MSETVDKKQQNEEISLVDLAVTFIQGRRIFFAVFFVVTSLGVAYALLAKETYQYNSLMQLAEKGSGTFIEEPETVLATLKNRWLPEQEARYLAETNRTIPFNVSFYSPEETGLIGLESEAPAERKEQVAKIHQNLIDSIEGRQKALLQQEKQRLESRLVSIDRSIETLQDRSGSGEAIAEAIDRKMDVESDLQALGSSEVLVVGRQSAVRTGPARTLIVLLSSVSGVILGMFLVFFVQFAKAVRFKMLERSS